MLMREREFVIERDTTTTYYIRRDTDGNDNEGGHNDNDNRGI